MAFSARDVIGTHPWFDHKSKVERKTRYDGRDWQDCNTKDCCGATKKGCVVITTTVGGAIIGGIVGGAIVGAPTAGLGILPGVVLGVGIGAALGAAVGVAITEIIEKCEKN